MLRSPWSRPRGESAPKGKSTTHPEGFPSITTPTSWRAPLPSRSQHAQPPPIVAAYNFSPVSIGADCGRSSLNCYPSSSPALCVAETSWTQWGWGAAAIEHLIHSHESDRPVIHDPAPIAIRDFKHEPGAPT
jgi:hypothetical protein